MALKGISRNKQAFAPLYSPNKPSSFTTSQARTLAPPAISPATCSRILTISRGLVKMTWEAPALKLESDLSGFRWVCTYGSSGNDFAEGGYIAVFVVEFVADEVVHLQL